MYDLLEELNHKVQQLDISVRQLRKTGTEAAQKEHDYKVLLSQEVLRLRDEKIAVGLINLIIYGLPAIARARLERDIATVIYEANKEAINSLKLQAKILNEQISREWGNPKGGTGS